jgi:hypothetical protein
MSWPNIVFSEEEKAKFESPRELRRLHYLREWSHEQDEQVFT